MAEERVSKGRRGAGKVSMDADRNGEGERLASFKYLIQKRSPLYNSIDD
jgi:hypothetical protein